MSDETKNTGSSDGTENTGSGQAAQPEQSEQRFILERQKAFNAGQGRGISRALEELGFNTSDLAAARAELDALRKGAPKAAHSEQTVPPEIIGKLALLEREQAAWHAERDVLSKRADVARRLAIQQAAIERGVGPGKQAEMFLGAYGDRFRISQDGSLVTVSKTADGHEIEGIDPVESVIASAIAEAPFLRAPERKPGGGSQQGAALPPPPASDHDKWREGQLRRFGVKK